jgi:hypothetical protein
MGIVKMKRKKNQCKSDCEWENIYKGTKIIKVCKDCGHYKRKR